MSSTRLALAVAALGALLVCVFLLRADPETATGALLPEGGESRVVVLEQGAGADLESPPPGTQDTPREPEEVTEPEAVPAVEPEAPPTRTESKPGERPPRVRPSSPDGGSAAPHGGAFDPATPGLSITGRVLDAAGDPVGKAHVQLSAWNRGSHGTSVGKGGEFGFYGRNPATYTLNASSKSGSDIAIALEQVVLETESVVVDLALKPAGKLKLTLTGVRESVRCRIMSDGLMLTDFTLRRDQPTEQVVPPGPVLVQLWTSNDGILHDQMTQVVAGRTEDVLLDLAR